MKKETVVEIEALYPWPYPEAEKTDGRKKYLALKPWTCEQLSIVVKKGKELQGTLLSK